MPEFSSNIVWNFDEFKPNTVWIAQKTRNGQRISAQQLEAQATILKRKTLSTLAKDTDPFALIRQSHDFLILDRKQRSKIKNLDFDFSSESGYYGPEEGGPQIHQNQDWPKIAQKIDQLNKHLKTSWQDCDTIISNLQRDQSPLGKKLYHHLNTSTLDVKVLLLGNNVIGVQKQVKDFVGYAIKYEDNSSKFQEQIKKDLSSLLNKSYPLAKYIIAFKRVQESVESVKLYQLELNIELSPNQNKKNLGAKLIVNDIDSLFAQALGYSLQKHGQLLEDYEFSTHGDYIQYPFKEQVAKRRRYMLQQSYSLVFQGGGAKGVAYVGAYAAIKQQKRGQNTVPISSIMGSSAGGIIALAVSTDIDPYEVQKICYKMGAIPRDYRIDRKFLTRPGGRFADDASLDREEQLMINRIIELLSEYGVIHRSSMEQIRKIILGIDKDKLAMLFQKLVQYLLATNESIGQMFDSRYLPTYKFNYLGLLLEGALMRGEAIYDIGLEVLVKFMLKNADKFASQDYRSKLGDSHFEELEVFVNGFDQLCKATFEISIDKIVQKQQETRTLFSIINKVLMIFGRHLAKLTPLSPEIFVLDQLFAKNLLDCFQFKSIYDVGQVAHQDLQDGQKKLFSIIYNHHKIHPLSRDLDEKDVSQKDQRLAIIKQFIKKNGWISYDKISQQLAEEYFLDSKNFKLKPKYKQFTLKQLISKIILKFDEKEQTLDPRQYKKLKQQYELLFNDAQFIRELAQIITDTLNAQPSTKEIVPIKNYIDSFQKFKQSVKDINLSTYYKLTKIELSCTSVDLDSQVLRFFNHKTTPNVPVCRAIQMTGSFPVGFKALSWDEQWGNYLIHYENYRRQVFLTGHQFTDGGLLANFPIKYFDNDYIRDCYFSHVVNRNHPFQTIMLGFGLDRLASQNYSPSEDESNTIKQTEIATQKALIALKRAAKDAILPNSVFSYPNFISKITSLTNTFLFPKKDTIQWKKIPENLIKDIPIFNFGFKLLNAYPRADRNFNLECFKDKIYRTMMLPQTKNIQDKNDQQRLEIEAQIYKDQKKGKVLQKEDNGWFNGWFGKGKQQQKEHPQRLYQLIQQAVDKTPLKSQYYAEIEDYSNYILESQKQFSNNLSFDNRNSLKAKIKQTMIRIILNRMQLQSSQQDIQWHTLQFISLRYSRRNIPPNVNDKQRKDDLSKKKFQDQLQKSYYRIEEELPFEEFKKKIYEIELLINFKQYDPKVSQEQLRNRYKDKIANEKAKLINQKKQYILKKLSDDDKKEYLNLPTFYITQNEKFLVQYIFLSKLHQEDLDRGNDFLQKTSVKKILKYFDRTQQNSQNEIYTYLTVKNLKAFYRRIFSSHRERYENNDYNRDTFLERQSLLGYQQEELQIQLNSTNLVDLATHFDSYYYLKKQIRMNHIHSQHLYWKKSVIEKIEFSRLLWEAFSDEQTRSKIQNQLLNLIKAYPAKYNKMLAELLYPNSKKVFTQAYFSTLIENQHLKRAILHTLFDRDGVYYSQNQHVLKKYEELFEDFKREKSQKLEKINTQILNPPDRHNNQGYSLKIQSEYLTSLESHISFKLLIKRITAAKNPTDYNLKTADLSSGMGVQTDRKQRQSIRTQINQQKSQQSMIYDDMLDRIYCYQFTFDKFEQYINQIIFLLYKYDGHHGFVFQQKRQHLMKNLLKIKEKLKSEINKVNQLPIESIELKHIKQIYTLQNSGIKDICGLIIQITKTIQDEELLKRISIYQNLFGSRFDLPQFRVIWRIHKNEFKQQKYSKAIWKSLNQQYSNSFVEKIKDKTQQIMIHLTLEGNDLSNFYYAHYYQLFQSRKSNVQKDQKNGWMPYRIEKDADRLRIAAITTSSYHSVFGFMVALNYSSNQLKYEMTQIRQLAYQMQPKESVTNYFDSYQWNASPSQYKEFWKYIKQEKYNVFRQFQKLANQSLPDNNLTAEFAKIKSLYEHQQQKIMRYCHQILEEVSDQVTNIDKNVEPRYKALEISQRYAYNYTCNMKSQHQFSTISKDSYQFFEKVIKRVFEGYGSLLEAVITNAYTAQVKVNLPTFEQGFVFKGFIVKQLLTTFKIKEYVIEKLRQNHLRESITLSEFFSHAPVKILLSFTTINVYKKRLQFMNKNTLPNMPVWAAIVSASCLPYFYRDFECPREWENGATDSASLYDLLVDDFFKSNNVNYKQAKYISGNIISSLPLQLLTNSTTLEKMFTFEGEPLPYLHLGYAFDVNQDIYKRQTYNLKRNFLQINLLQIPKLFFSSPPKPKFNKNCGKITQNHKNSTYNKNTSTLSRLLQIKGKTEILKYISILSESNDNFMLHTYWDKLIRLPIKIDTLNFNEIIDRSLERRFGVNVASEKGKNTIQRSYEITKYFQQQRFRSDQNRYKVNLRITIVQEDDEIYGKMANIAKVQILSHSKWNRNRYNNFLVQYSINHQNFNSQAKFAFDSQFLWNITDSVVMYLRFYFPRYAGVENLDAHSSILFSQLQLNISDIVAEIPLKNSYDYALSFNRPAENRDQRDLQTGLILSNNDDIEPFKKNMILANPKEKNPKLSVRKWLTGEKLDKNSYIHHL